MEINSDLLSLIAGLIIGLFSGFFTAIVFDLWKQYQERRRLKDLIRQELGEIRSQLDSHLKSAVGGVVKGRSYRRSVFDEVRGDILRKLNVKVSRQIEITYAQVVTLGAGCLRGKCEEVLNSIDDTMKILGDC